MAVRTEERLSAEALQRHLQSRYGIASLWSGVDSDPPDLRFEVMRKVGGTESWAAEVTGLIQYIEWDSSEVNRRVFEPAIFKMCKRLNDELGQQMSTGYFLSVTGPFDPLVFRNLERRVREYLKSGKTNEEALDYPETLASVLGAVKGDPDDPGVQRAVQQVVKDRIKVTMQGSSISKGIVVFSGISGVAKIPNSDELAANVDSTLTYAVKRIVDVKLPRMEKVVGYDRKVLLVWSGIPFADATDVLRHFQTLHPTGIDGIFFVELGKDWVSLVFDLNLSL